MVIFLCLALYWIKKNKTKDNGSLRQDPLVRFNELLNK